MATKNINAEKIQGNLNITSISASTISGTTYYGDGSNLTGISSEDNFVTGGTFTTNTLTLNRQNGSVTITGFTSDTNTTVTGFTYDNANTFTIGNSDGSNYSASINSVTGLTVNGSISATTISATTFYGDGSNLNGVATFGPLKIINLTSTSTSSTFSRTSPLICPWDVETYKDAGFTHSNSVNNTRITMVEDGTYQIAASIRIYENADQRAQSVARILINGNIQAQPYGSAYIRGSGNSSDYWSCVVNPPPIKLSAGDYVEVQIQGESSLATTLSSVFQGDESSFSVINLNGIKGSKGDSGSLTGNTGVNSDTFSGLTTTATYYGDGSNLTGIAAAFGSYYQSDETLAEANTTNTSPGANTSNPRADITTSSIPSGTYRVGWSLEWKASSQDQRWNGRVRVDDTTNIMEMASEPAKENKDEWRAIGGFGNQTFGSSGAHTVEMDWWSESGSGTAYIRKARIEFWRVT